MIAADNFWTPLLALAFCYSLWFGITLPWVLLFLVLMKHQQFTTKQRTRFRVGYTAFLALPPLIFWLRL